MLSFSSFLAGASSWDSIEDTTASFSSAKSSGRFSSAAALAALTNSSWLGNGVASVTTLLARGSGRAGGRHADSAAKGTSTGALALALATALASVFVTRFTRPNMANEIVLIVLEAQITWSGQAAR